MLLEASSENPLVDLRPTEVVGKFRGKTKRQSWHHRANHCPSHRSHRCLQGSRPLDCQNCHRLRYCYPPLHSRTGRVKHSIEPRVVRGGNLRRRLAARQSKISLSFRLPSVAAFLATKKSPLTIRGGGLENRMGPHFDISNTKIAQVRASSEAGS